MNKEIFGKIKISIACLVLVGFTQTTLAVDNIQKKSSDSNSSKCSTMKMKGNVVITSDSAKVYTDKQNRTLVVLPKSDKKIQLS